MNASYYGIKELLQPAYTTAAYAQFRFSFCCITFPHLRAMMGARYVLCGAA